MRQTVSRGQGLIWMAMALTGLGLLGCGEEAADSTGPTATQRITREFGRELMSVDRRVPLGGPGTVMRLLRDHHDVATVFDGRVVSAVDGRRDGDEGGDETLWVLNVNGIEADELPPDYHLFAGDVVQWDLRDWYVRFDVRATVGAFPETFTRGVFGRRFPVTVECQRPAAEACALVSRTLRDAGVSIDGSAPGGQRPPNGQPQRARILVGEWKHWRDRPWPHRIDEGPAYSGVFARFDPSGRAIRLLDWDGRVARVEDASTGLVAAMRPTEEDLLWLVTGGNTDGVRAAARTLADAGSLRDAFAAAVTPDGAVKLPLPPSRVARR